MLNQLVPARMPDFKINNSDKPHKEKFLLLTACISVKSDFACYIFELLFFILKSQKFTLCKVIQIYFYKAMHKDIEFPFLLEKVKMATARFLPFEC